jgi:hypothetical protein
MVAPTKPEHIAHQTGVTAIQSVETARQNAEAIRRAKEAGDTEALSAAVRLASLSTFKKRDH